MKSCTKYVHLDDLYLNIDNSVIFITIYKYNSWSQKMLIDCLIFTGTIVYCTFSNYKLTFEYL